MYELIKEGLRIGRTAKALWVYGFFVGLGAVGHNGDGHTPRTPAPAHFAPHAFTGNLAVLAIVGLMVLAAGVFMYFVSEGALIEGVTRVRLGKFQTVAEGWRDGLAHWGALLRIAVIYFGISGGSLVVLGAPFLIALKLSSTALAVALAVPAAFIAVPWLATLYMWQAFASRIAVLENRRALDAIGKARLFLHGRLIHGLKLILASILGQLIIVVLGVIGLAAAALFALAVLKAFGMTHAPIPVIALGAMLLLPTAFLMIAISGTTQSSIWTIGYLTEQKQ